MDYLALQTEVNARPECAAFVHTNDMPKISASEARAKDQAIADILNLGRVRVTSPFTITDRGVRAAMPPTLASPLLRLLRDTAADPAIPVWLTDVLTVVGIPMAEHEDYADSLKSSWHWLLDPDGIDIGSAAARMMLDLIAMSDRAKYGAAVGIVKAMAEVPNPVTADDISRAMRGPWE